MSMRPDDERDPELERAWRAQSRENPPAALDRAILAAAHRAVGSGPAALDTASAARRPQRWWMPLAAAAAIGIVAIGVLQVSPQDESLVVPSERVASSTAPRDVAAPAASPSKQDALAEPEAFPRKAQGDAGSGREMQRAPRADVPAAADTLTNSAASARQKVAPDVASPAPAAPPAVAPQAGVAQRTAPGSSASAPPAPAINAATPAPSKEAAIGRLSQQDVPTPAAKRETAPEPFPAAPRGEVATTPSPRPAEQFAQVPTAPGATEADARSTERKDVVPPRQASAQPAPAAAPPPVPALAAAKPQPPSAAGGASSLAANAGANRMRENATGAAGARDELREQSAAAPPLAKTLADAKAKARDPDAWLARIRKLRDDGNTAEAVREMREFRENVPDADRRIPADLREIANLGAR